MQAVMSLHHTRTKGNPPSEREPYGLRLLVREQREVGDYASTGCGGQPHPKSNQQLRGLEGEAHITLP